MMLVVIEVDDWSDNDALLRELRMVEKSRNDIATDDTFDPDEDGDALVLHTEHIEVGVARIVGTVSPVYGQLGEFVMRPLES
jgi:hypothetical protein